MLLRATIQTTIDEECEEAGPALGEQGLPSPSVTELRALAQICHPELRVIKVFSDARLVGLAICCLEQVRIHGVAVKACKLFGGHLHDYTRLYAADRQSLIYLLDKVREDARACGRDVVELGNLLLPHDADAVPRQFSTSFQVGVFDAAASETGWRPIMEKQSGQREWKRAARLQDFHFETCAGQLSQGQIEEVARLHRERWSFDGKPCAFDNPRRVAEYLCHPATKVLTTVCAQGEILGLHYGMVYGDLLLFHTPVINVKYLDLSPLKLVLHATAQFCREKGLRFLDFGLGSESYKDAYANDTRTVYNVLCPLSARGKLVHLIRQYGSPEKTKTVLGTLHGQAGRLKKWLRHRLASPPQWYGTVGDGHDGHPHRLTCLETYAEFVDFCRRYHLPFRKQHYRRYKDGAIFLALHDDNTVLAQAWVTRRSPCALVEGVPSVSNDEGLLLFDLACDEAAPRSCLTLLRWVKARFPGEKLRLNAPAAWEGDILKAGFSRIMPSPAAIAQGKLNRP